jgi:hypothetical protein
MNGVNSLRIYTVQGDRNFHQEKDSSIFVNIFSSKKTVEEVAKTGCIWLRIVDMGGVKNIRATDPNSLFIYISPPSPEVLEQRLRDRKTDTENVIKKRLEEAEESMEFSKTPGIYNHIIVNDQINVAYKKLKEILSNVIHLKSICKLISSSPFFFMFRKLKPSFNSRRPLTIEDRDLFCSNIQLYHWKLEKKFFLSKVDLQKSSCDGDFLFKCLKSFQ